MLCHKWCNAVTAPKRNDLTDETLHMSLPRITGAKESNGTENIRLTL